MTAASTPQRPSNSLPSPAERPAADVVLYDGQCRICTGAVERLHRWDSRGRLAYLSLHDPEVARRFPDLDHDALMRDMYLVDRGGRRFRGAAALRVVALRLPWFWPAVPLLYLPGTLPVWQWLYRRLADRRYRFGKQSACDGGTCSLHGHGR